MTLMQRRRALCGTSEENPTDPKCVYESGYVIGAADGGIAEWSVSGVTEYYSAQSGDVIAFRHPAIPSQDYYPRNSAAIGNKCLGYFIAYYSNKQKREYWNNKADGNERTLTMVSGTAYFRLNVYISGLADSYCVNKTTGQVYYAGKNTQYYGKANISD